MIIKCSNLTNLLVNLLDPISSGHDGGALFRWKVVRIVGFRVDVEREKERERERERWPRH